MFKCLWLERRDNELSFFDLIGDDEDDCLDSADVCSVAVLEPDADDDDPSDLPDRLDLTDDLRDVLVFLYFPGVLIRSVVSGRSAV